MVYQMCLSLSVSSREKYVEGGLTQMKNKTRLLQSYLSARLSSSPRNNMMLSRAQPSVPSAHWPARVMIAHGAKTNITYLLTLADKPDIDYNAGSAAWPTY